MLILLACSKSPIQPIDSDPVVEDTGCDVGVMPGDCPADYDLYDATGTVHTLLEHQTAVASVTVMWDPTWQERVRDVDAFFVDHPEIPTFDILVENLAEEPPIADDALLWEDSLDLSLTVLLSDDAFRETWLDPAENGAYVVLVRDGVVQFRGTSATVEMKEALEASL